MPAVPYMQVLRSVDHATTGGPRKEVIALAPCARSSLSWR